MVWYQHVDLGLFDLRLDRRIKSVGSNTNVIVSIWPFSMDEKQGLLMKQKERYRHVFFTIRFSLDLTSKNGNCEIGPDLLTMDRKLGPIW